MESVVSSFCWHILHLLFVIIIIIITILLLSHHINKQILDWIIIRNVIIFLSVLYTVIITTTISNITSITGSIVTLLLKYRR